MFSNSDPEDEVLNDSIGSPCTVRENSLSPVSHGNINLETGRSIIYSLRNPKRHFYLNQQLINESSVPLVMDQFLQYTCCFDEQKASLIYILTCNVNSIYQIPMSVFRKLQLRTWKVHLGSACYHHRIYYHL